MSELTTEQSSREREAFEAWYSTKLSSAPKLFGRYQDPDDASEWLYLERDVDNAWFVWQGARSALSGSAESGGAVAWLFKCKKPGTYMEYSTLDENDSNHWPVDQWTSIEKIALGPLSTPSALSAQAVGEVTDAMRKAFDDRNNSLEADERDGIIAAILALAAPMPQAEPTDERDMDALLTLLKKERMKTNGVIAEVESVRNFYFANNPANTGLAIGFNAILALLNSPAAIISAPQEAGKAEGECPGCGGLGRIRVLRCEQCDGTGRILASPSKEASKVEPVAHIDSAKIEALKDTAYVDAVLSTRALPFTVPVYLRPTQQALSDAKDAARYRWLRGGMRKTRRPDDAPYVVNPRRSKLYAVVNYAGEELDAAIDEDRLNDMTQWVYEEALTEGDNRFADPNFRFSDEFANECTEKARAILAAAGGSEK